MIGLKLLGGGRFREGGKGKGREGKGRSGIPGYLGGR